MGTKISVKEDYEDEARVRSITSYVEERVSRYIFSDGAIEVAEQKLDKLTNMFGRLCENLIDNGVISGIDFLRITGDDDVADGEGDTKFELIKE